MTTGDSWTTRGLKGSVPPDYGGRHVTAPSRRRRRADARPSWNAAELPARHVTSVSRKRPLEKDRGRYGWRSGPMRNERALNLNDSIKKDTKYNYHIAGDFLEGQIQNFPLQNYQLNKI